MALLDTPPTRMRDLVIPDTLHREPLVFDLLGSTNFASWRKNMRILLMRMSLLDLIDREPPRDATNAWFTANKWAFSEIYFQCTPEVQASLSDTMTARKAWTALEAIYHSSSTANIFQLTVAFNTLRQRPDQSVLSFINVVISAASDLKHLGVDVSDQKVKWQILANLLPEYAPLVTTLTNLDRDHDPLDIADLRESCLREERIIHRCALLSQPAVPVPAPIPSASDTTAPSVALAASSRPIRCHECGVLGHTVRDCWIRYPELRPALYRSRSRGALRNREDYARYGCDRDRDRYTRRGRSTSRDRYTRDRYRRRRSRSYGREHTPRRDRRSRSPRRNRSPAKPPKDTEIPSHATDDKVNRSDKNKRSKYRRRRDSSSSDESIPRHAKSTLLLPSDDSVLSDINHACMVRSPQSTSTTRPPRWLLDSGASNHYTSDVSLLTNVVEIRPTPVETANKVVHATARGSLILHLSCGTISISDVMFVPDLLPNTHLISVGQLESKGLEFHMRHGKCYMF